MLNSKGFKSLLVNFEVAGLYENAILKIKIYIFYI